MRHANFLIKPASSACNLRCRYCFYEDEAENRTLKNMGLMSRETAETLLNRAFAEIEPGGSLSFAFQGGEPTVAGLDFFRFFTAKARELKPERVQISFSIQTNGTLLNEDWAEFFRREDFLVGLSMDGYKDCHDMHRVDAAGKATWNRVTRALSILKKHAVKVNALCVVTARCAKNPEKAYTELKKLGFEFIQFIACMDPIGEERGNQFYSLTPEAYGRFLCRAFDLWYKDWESGNYHSVRLFDDYVHILLGDGAGTCATCGSCGAYFVVEGDGSVYPCDFYVLDDWRMGSLLESSLKELAESEKGRQFLFWGLQKPGECAGCRWRRICNGGCKNDWVRDAQGQPHNYYCAAFRALLEHAMPRLQIIARAELAARGGIK